MKFKKIFRWAWFSAVAVFLIWQWYTFQAHDLPANTFTNTPQLSVVEAEDEILFKPLQSPKNVEIIFFQGGLADPKAYAPLCRKIAEQGYICHLMKMAWRMPQNDYQKITELFDLANGNYIIGGHSQGAKMAAQFVYEQPNLMKGLFLLGTSHPRDVDLSQLSIPTLKLYAEKDGLASVPEVLENQGKLPQHTTLTLIKGGNHSQFGYLGTLFMDNSADISLETQQQTTLTHLLSHFETIAEQ